MWADYDTSTQYWIIIKYLPFPEWGSIYSFFFSSRCRTSDDSRNPRYGMCTHLVPCAGMPNYTVPNSSTMELQTKNSMDAPKQSPWWLLTASSVNNVCFDFHLEMTLINRLTELNTPMTLFINDGASSDCSSTPPNILCKITVPL